MHPAFWDAQIGTLGQNLRTFPGTGRDISNDHPEPRPAILPVVGLRRMVAAVAERVQDPPLS